MRFSPKRFLSFQTSGHIIAMPEKNIVLVKLDRIPGEYSVAIEHSTTLFMFRKKMAPNGKAQSFISAYSLQQLNTRNRKADNGNRFIYVNKELLVWNYQGHWIVQELTKGLSC